MKHLVVLWGVVASLAVHAQPSALRLIAAAEVPRGGSGVLQQFGGISGLDCDAEGRCMLLSDDRERPRAYAASLRLTEDRTLEIEVQRMQPLAVHPGERPDPESLRLQPGGVLLWTSEGDRARGEPPSLRRSGPDGSMLTGIALPSNLMHDPQRGPRHNLSLEGLAVMPGGDLVLALEGPLLEDGEPPSRHAGAVVRITRLCADGRLRSQHAYELDPIRREASGGLRRADNGISEILALDDDTLLVVERSGVETAPARFEFDVRVYLASFDGATDVPATAALADAAYRPMRKRLLLDLSQVGLPHVDNIEAAAWGPRLPDGRRALVLASDDNFSLPQRNQFLLLELLP